VRTLPFLKGEIMAEVSKRETKPKLNLKYMRDKHREPVRGKFVFHEVPGGTVQFSFREFKEDPVEKFTLTDGEIYTLPLGVAKHLNKNCWYPVHSYQSDETGRAIQKIGSKVRRMSFQSLEFVDIEDISPVGETGIVSVENINMAIK